MEAGSTRQIQQVQPTGQYVFAQFGRTYGKPLGGQFFEQFSANQVDLPQIRLCGVLFDPGTVLHSCARVGVTFRSPVWEEPDMVTGHLAKAAIRVTADVFDGVCKGRAG